MNFTDKKRKLRSQEAGIVLLDVLFAVFVLGIAALYLAETRSNTIVRAGGTARLRIARMLASKKMEEILVNEVSEEDQGVPTDGTFEDDGYSDFTYDVDVEDISISTDEDLEDPEKRQWNVRRVTVIVTYPGENKQKETFSITTILPEVLEEEGG